MPFTTQFTLYVFFKEVNLQSVQIDQNQVTNNEWNETQEETKKTQTRMNKEKCKIRLNNKI